MKYIFIPILIILFSCSCTIKTTKPVEIALKDEMNQSIIDGFFNGGYGTNYVFAISYQL